MLLLNADPEDIYVPFVSSRHGSNRVHEVRRREPRVGTPRRMIGRALIRAGLSLAGLGANSAR
jgi:hypothetical protein